MADTIVKLNPNTWLQAESTSGDCSAGDPAILKTSVTAIAPGTGATSLGKAEDAAHASGDVGVAILAKRTDTAAVSAGTDGDYATVNVDSTGRLWSHVGAVDAGESHIGEVGGALTRASANFTRPADATAYASGDLVANSTTAGSVTPLTLTCGRGSSGSAATGLIRRIKIHKTNTGVTNSNFRVHLYSASPTCTNGDNGAWLTTQAAGYLGAFDVTVDRAFSDGAAGVGVPVAGNDVAFTAQTVYGLIEARGAYTPGNAEVFTVTAEVLQN